MKPTPFMVISASALFVAGSLLGGCDNSSSVGTSPGDGGGDVAHKVDANVGDAKRDAPTKRDATSDATKPVDATFDASDTGHLSDSGDAGDAGDTAPEMPMPGAPASLLLDCDPMVPQQCGFPFPSSVWTTPDPSMSTGVHVYFGSTTLPTSSQNVHIGSGSFLTRDGFSPGSTILTYIAGATGTGLPGPDNIALSVTTSSPTILMEADTGALVPHFSEIDARTTDPTQQAFMIHPAIRMKDATRYIVAIRKVVDANGHAIPANPVFAALRDNTPSNDISVAPRRQLYSDIMGKLSTHGVSTGDLQIAWDFTTASQVNTTQWLLHMRDDALSVVGAAGPSYTITSVDTNPNPHIAKRLHGMMTVPLYLTAATVPATINFNDAGVPTQNGTASFPFLVHIPNSLYNTGKAGPIIENAHGLLGDESEGQDSYLADICDREGYVAVAVDLLGMDSDDTSAVAGAVGGDVSLFEQSIERQHQGLVNELLAIRMMMGGLATDPQTMGAMGMPTIDPTQRFYRGDSQGGIFGATFMSISTDVTRGLLGEPGAPYSLLLDRSADFDQFFVLIKIAYPRPLDDQFIISLIDLLWDRTEPDGYIPYMTTNTLPNTPSHTVLIEAALGDHQVTTLGAEFIARTIGAQNLKAVNQEVFGVTDAVEGFSGSALVEWNFGLPPAPLSDNPATAGTDPHDELRFVTDEQDQADQFLRTGVVHQLCPDGGPCAVVGCDAGTSSCTAGH